MNKKIILALVGRPNVGKSTLFNRLTRSRNAIVNDQPGITRDRQARPVDYYGYNFILIDTGGFEPSANTELQKKMRAQSQLAAEEADGVIYMLDRLTSWNYQDQDILNYLRKFKKPIYFVINKVDAEQHETIIYDYYESGSSEIFTISAEHGRGVHDLLEKIALDFPDIQEHPDVPSLDDHISIAVVGRPNAGKSSLINQFLGETKHIVHNEAGTTRDAIDSFCKFYGQSFRLIDTAGIRQKSRVSQIVDHYSMVSSIRSIESADIALLIVNACDGFVEQDAKIASYILERYTAMIIIINKWDLIVKDSLSVEKMRDEIYDRFPFVSFAPMLFVSAKTGQRVTQILSQVKTSYQEYSKRIQTADVNRVLNFITSRHQPPIGKNRRRIKFLYASQVSTAPPTFIISTNQPDQIPSSYQQFITTQFRNYFGFSGIPIKIYFKLNSKKLK